MREGSAVTLALAPGGSALEFRTEPADGAGEEDPMIIGGTRPMNVIRWNDPFRDLATLQDRLNRAFDSTLARAGANEEELFTGTWAPPVDIFETKDKTILKAELPGFNENQIPLRFEDGILSLEGERKFEKENGDENYHRVERSYGKFVRSFTIPVERRQREDRGLVRRTASSPSSCPSARRRSRSDQDHAGEAGDRGPEVTARRRGEKTEVSAPCSLLKVGRT